MYPDKYCYMVVPPRIKPINQNISAWGGIGSSLEAKSQLHNFLYVPPVNIHRQSTRLTEGI